MSPARSTASLRPLAPPPPGAPRLAPGLVPRPRLLRALAAARELPLVLLAAPAGFGKTTLLAEWAARDGRPFSWIRPSELSGPGAAARVLAEHAGADPEVIVLDDAQRAPAAAVDALAELAGRLPAGSSLAVATRRRPGPAAGRLRAHRLALALGPPELAMTRLECSLLLAAAGARLDAADVDRLAARTHGWPAALAMAGEALAHAPGEAAVWRGGADRLVAGYVRSELLAGLRADRLAFLRRTAIAERAHAGAVQRDPRPRRRGPHARGARHGRAAARAARRRRLPLPSARPRAAASRPRAARARARGWSCTGAPRATTAARTGPRTPCGTRSRAATRRTPAACCSRSAPRRRPPGGRRRCAPGCARSARASSPRTRSSRWPPPPCISPRAAATTRCAGSRPPTGRRARVGRGPERTAALALLQACAGSTGVAAMAADAERAAALMGPGQPWPALATLLGGVARHLGGDRPGAEAQLARAARPETGGLALVRALAHAQLALLSAETEAWERAGDHAASAREALAELAAPLPAVAVVHAAVAAVAAHAGRRRRGPPGRRRGAPAARRRRRPAAVAGRRGAGLARARGHPAQRRRGRPRPARPRRAAACPVPDAPVLAEWLHDGWERADAFAAGETGELPALTMAELRVLRFLPSHLSFREIGDRLHVSANTVKTQALSAYRKLDVGCRSEAVARGRAVGLIDG